MGSPFVGEIRMFGGAFAPFGWAFCDGSLISIAENETLFQLIGTTYGGDGVNTYALPDLRSRAPLHVGADSFGDNYVLGASAGVENVTLLTNQLGAHNHTVNAVASGGETQSPANALPGLSTSEQQSGTLQYGTGAGNPTTFAPASVATAGGGQPHTNLQPYLAISFIISLFGIFPQQN